MALVLALLTGAGNSLGATTYYLDPAAGDLSNPGTDAAPWGTLEAVAQSGRTFQSGDVLVLRSGHHGAPTIRGVNLGEVVIRPAQGARATLRSLRIRAAKKWRIQALEISPSTAPTFERTEMVSIAADAAEIVLENCRLYTVADTTAWSAADWDTRACNGIGLSGPNNVVRSNHLQNINFGISVTGASNLVERNVIENFSGDGLRGLGDYGVFERNVVKNCYDVNANHDDGFQSWSVGPDGVGTGIVRGVVLRGNRIINYEDPAQPHRGTLQGIGCFDGFFEDWVIENNEILTDHWHGITLSGARNCRIVNNTVVDRNTTSPGPPWIRIGNHKNGTASTGNVIRNNLATDFSVDTGVAVMDHNLETSDYAAHFRDYTRRDLRLISSSAAIDAGSPEWAPRTDAAGVPRPLDGNADGTAAWDLGAHEFAHAQADADQDRASDADELLAGTSPIDPADRLELAAALVPPNQVVLTWHGVRGRLYSIRTRPDAQPGEWQELPTPGITSLVGQDDRLRCSVAATATSRSVFRLSVSEP